MHETRLLDKQDFQKLVDLLWDQGYRVLGPTVSQAAIVFGEIRAIDDLPRGWTDEQSGGEYRLKRREDDAWFGFVVGPHSPKQHFFPSRVTVVAADRDGDAWRMRDVPDDEPPVALLGVRACDLAAIAVQDRTFMHARYSDPIYRRRREQALIIAVNCTQAASTCFCTSMNTGPRCSSGFDLALTELPDCFTVEVGSPQGAALAALLPTRPADPQALRQAEIARQHAVDDISKQLDTNDLRDLLLNNLEHPRWSEVATRCLSCTNCTMVCPTCFCSSVKEVSDLDVEHVERVREWDTCFNWDFSYLNGGVVRDQIRSRYRQWLTHKLASWVDQFGVSGCVGCGRCITWCPVGIDLTEEVAAIRETPV
ncbi:MAG: 4Fe-4S dicluster domain-containing protein [Pirellulales bacterium]|nr:4Fe-4S dicluster domain-containing protein [Pirellulales bacterium]